MTLQLQSKALLNSTFQLYERWPCGKVTFNSVSSVLVIRKVARPFQPHGFLRNHIIWVVLHFFFENQEEK